MTFEGMFNAAYMWWGISAQPFQVVTASLYISGFNLALPDRPSGRLFAESVDYRGEVVGTALAGGAYLRETYVWEKLEGSFVMPEDASKLRIGVWIDPEAMSKGTVLFNYFSQLKKHPLVDGHLLDPFLVENVPFS